MRVPKRSVRRHHRERMIEHALRSYMFYGEPDSDDTRQRVLRWYNNLKKCGCWMCRNPRKVEAMLTLQEERLLAAAREEEEPA
jgi:hypothetical protein